MNKKEAEKEKVLLQHEKQVIKDLKEAYDNAAKDINARILNLQNSLQELRAVDTTGYDDRSKEILESQIQSKVYQLEYQKILDKQIGSCIDVLKQDTTTNVQTYLHKVYEDSYLGNLYAINAKGIPITTPINPSVLVETINKKTDDMTYAQRINTNMNDFKKKIKSEITRGMANGSTYKEIAKMVSMVTGEDLYKSERIVRTEGARVSSSARLTQMRDAKEKGADLVKQWDSTLDGKTRELHGKLDGQIAEINKPFNAGGYKVEAPGMFGDPSQDCNCRCVVLSVPRWDIDDKVVKYDNEHNEMIETKNYETWKQGYYMRVDGQIAKDMADDIINTQAPKEIVKLWNTYKDNIHIEVDKKANDSLYDPVKEKITMKLEDRENVDTILHEIGHNIDRLSSTNDKPYSFNKLKSHLENDYTNLIDGIIDNLSKDEKQDLEKQIENKIVARYKNAEKQKLLSSKEVEEILKDKTSIQYLTDYTEIKEELYEAKAMEYIKKKYEGKHESEIRDVSDMIQAVSKEKYDLGYGHDKGYFDVEDQQETEAFANMFDTTIYNPKALGNIKELFPETYEEFLKLLKKMK